MKALWQSQGERFGTHLRGSKVEIRGSQLVGVAIIPFIVRGPGTMLQPRIRRAFRKEPWPASWGYAPQSGAIGKINRRAGVSSLQRGGEMSTQNRRYVPAFEF
jgi:hypothetical protein